MAELQQHVPKEMHRVEWGAVDDRANDCLQLLEQVIAVRYCSVGSTECRQPFDRACELRHLLQPSAGNALVRVQGLQLESLLEQEPRKPYFSFVDGDLLFGAERVLSHESGQRCGAAHASPKP